MMVLFSHVSHENCHSSPRPLCFIIFFFSFSQPSRELAQQVCTHVALNETDIELFLLTIFPLPVTLLPLP